MTSVPPWLWLWRLGAGGSQRKMERWGRNARWQINWRYVLNVAFNALKNVAPQQLDPNSNTVPIHILLSHQSEGRHGRCQYIVSNGRGKSAPAHQLPVATSISLVIIAMLAASFGTGQACRLPHKASDHIRFSEHNSRGNRWLEIPHHYMHSKNNDPNYTASEM